MALTISRRVWMGGLPFKEGGGIKGSNISHCLSERLGGIRWPAHRDSHRITSTFLICLSFAIGLLSHFFGYMTAIKHVLKMSIASTIHIWVVETAFFPLLFAPFFPLNGKLGLTAGVA